jgi:solute carrier family 25 protein 38
MTSEAHEATAPITFSTIKGLFKQGRYSFEIKHSPQDANQPQQIISLADESSVSTEDGKQVFHYSADLKFPAGRQAVWELSFDVKDPGSLELEAVEMEIETDTYSVIYFVRTLHFQLPCLWYIPTKEGYWHKRMSRETPWIVEVKPKPPKVKLSILNIDQGIYTDEPVELTFQFTNEEEEEVSVAVDARLLSRQGAPELSWQLTDGPEATKPSSRALELPNLAPTHSSSQTATFTAPPTPGKLILEAKLHYFLPSDPAIPLTKTFTETLAVTSPFEANYDFRPCTHPAPWPSYFSADAPAPGLLQRWRLDVRMASFAAAPLAVHAVAVAPTRIPPGLASCVVVDAEEEQRQSEMAPRTMRALPFTLDTVRRPAKEHRAAALEAAVTVAWSRVRRGAASGSGRAPPAVVSSTLAVPPLVVPALEPRVVADAVHGRAPGGGKDPSSTAAPAEGEGDVGAGGVPLTTLTLVMENPTAHPLTFDVAAPSGERLAFAGPKQAAVALLPYSRGEVVYRLVPLRGKDGGDDAEGDKRVVFGVRVQDRYFVREVEVLAGEGLEAHEGGVSWVVE